MALPTQNDKDVQDPNLSSSGLTTTQPTGGTLTKNPQDDDEDETPNLSPIKVTGVNFLKPYEIAQLRMQKIDQELQDRYEKAQSALNDPFGFGEGTHTDPGAMFALAQGFLTPGRTGSFGEALGAASGKLNEYQKELRNQIVPLTLAQMKTIGNLQKLNQGIAGIKYATQGTGFMGADDTSATGSIGANGAPIPKALQLEKLNAQIGLLKNIPGGEYKIPSLQAQADMLKSQVDKDIGDINTRHTAYNTASQAADVVLPAAKFLANITNGKTPESQVAKSALDYINGSDTLRDDFNRIFSGSGGNIAGGSGSVSGGIGFKLDMTAFNDLINKAINQFTGEKGGELTLGQRNALKQALIAQGTLSASLPAIGAAANLDPSALPVLNSVDNGDSLNLKARKALSLLNHVQGLAKDMYEARAKQPALGLSDYLNSDSYKNRVATLQKEMNEADTEHSQGYAMQHNIEKTPLTTPSVATVPSAPAGRPSTKSKYFD